MKKSLELDGAVCCWLIPVPERYPDFFFGSAWMDPYEKAQMTTFFHADDRLLYMTAHLWLRRILSEATGLSPASLRFHRPEQGKPALTINGSRGYVSFSLSRSRGYVAIAVSRCADVGVDVERIRDRKFGQDDALRLSQHSDAAFRLWTAKEAYTKAMGGGARRSFETFGVTLTDEDRYMLDGRTSGANPEQGSGYSMVVEETEPANRFAFSVFTKARDVPLVTYRIPPGMELTDCIIDLPSRRFAPEFADDSMAAA